MKYAFMLQYPLMGLKDIFQIEIKETVEGLILSHNGLLK